jgi:hypothetical protein
MHPRRHLIVLFTLAMFVASSLLAAMPLVWCVGKDGHRGVEYSLSAADTHLDHKTFGAEADEQAPVKTADCHDWQLVGKAKVAPPDSAGVIPFALRVMTLLPTLPTSLESADPPSPFRDPGSFTASATQREALRSTILRI